MPTLGCWFIEFTWITNAYTVAVRLRTIVIIGRAYAFFFLEFTMLVLLKTHIYSFLITKRITTNVNTNTNILLAKAMMITLMCGFIWDTLYCKSITGTVLTHLNVS